MLDREFIELQEALAGEYSLERELGRGGMGIVYLAREVQLDRLVAIKVLPEALAAKPAIRERFVAEARMAASLSHPHVVPIYRVGEARGFAFFVMAYVKGETLGERLRSRGPLPPAVATRLLREVAWALSYAHGRGIVHRDVKPDNILIEDETGRALVTDFGIARGAAANELSDPGRVMGTAHFMSPEQAASEPVDGRSDLYSLGIVAYLALSGRLPFDAPTVPALLAKQLGSEPPALASVAPAAPHTLVAVIERCLRKMPDERFASGEQLGEALETASTPARAKMPLALRVWTRASDPLRPVYMVWSGIFTMGLLSELRGGHDRFVILAFDLLPLVPITIFHARKTYQALSAGYTLRDLRAALAAWQSERREELGFELSEAEPFWARALRWLAYGLTAAAGVAFVTGVPHTLAGRFAVVSLVVGTVGTLTIANALGVRLLGRRIRPRLVGSLRSLIWNSRFGEWAAKLLSPRHRTPIAGAEHRPTEMALGLAAEELFAALPKTYRDELHDLPAVVRRLEAHAAAARARIDELDALASIGASGRSNQPASIASARDRARRELAESVAALEAIRLDLLRLHGGSRDLHATTTVLDAARELGAQLDRLTEAQAEVNQAISATPLMPQPHTPT